MDLKTQEDEAYEQLRDLILAGELAVGEFLSQRMLASRVGAAVITVRGALRRLENDGLIENVPRWGVRIPRETEEQIQDRYFVREVLELAALRRLGGTLGAREAEELLVLARHCDELGAKGSKDARAFAEAHLAFHRFLPDCCGSWMLKVFLERLNLQSLMLFNAQRGWARGVDRDAPHHEKLARILSAGDVERAETQLREHIRRGLDNELAAFQAKKG